MTEATTITLSSTQFFLGIGVILIVGWVWGFIFGCLIFQHKARMRHAENDLALTHRLIHNLRKPAL